MARRWRVCGPRAAFENAHCDRRWRYTIVRLFNGERDNEPFIPSRVYPELNTAGLSVQIVKFSMTKGAVAEGLAFDADTAVAPHRPGHDVKGHRETT
jgi:hypothetical protein